MSLDATRLRARLKFDTPTGIDRVDLAYLDFLKSRDDIELNLVSYGTFGVRAVSSQSARRIVDKASTTWSGPMQWDERPQFKALSRWLESPSSADRPILRDDPKSESRQNRDPPGLGHQTAVAPAPLRHHGDSAGLYINTSHGQLFRSAYPRWFKRSPSKNLFFVHDLIPIKYPEYNRPREPARHVLRLATIAKHASCVIVNSKATQTELLEYWSDRSTRAPDVAVAPLGINLPTSDFRLPSPRALIPYFVMIGTIEPRKNHIGLLNVWRHMVDQYPKTAPRLVLAGRRGWENEAVFNMLDRCSTLDKYVIECPSLSDVELAAILRGARAALNPSFAEGYGLPVAEALATGTPVLASDLSAHREVGGRYADYIQPYDGMGWLQAVIDFAVPGSGRRERALSRLSSYRPPRWSDHFDVVIERIRYLAR